MIYDIKPIPTFYAGVRFRSRLEARWSAYFDLNRWKWVYEPIDLFGWAPDFSISTPFCTVFAEVKPTETTDSSAFKKAERHYERVQVLLLGLEPKPWAIGGLMDPIDNAEYLWVDVNDYLRVLDPNPLWREAGNIVQWLPRGAA